jgi:2-methylisocitrate lyase-like PEP mutase family enzyme
LATSGKTPFLGREEIERLGFKLIIYPNWVMLAAIRAADHVLATLKETGTIAGIAGEVASFREFLDLLGMPEVQARARYGIDEGARVGTIPQGARCP